MTARTLPYPIRAYVDGRLTLSCSPLPCLDHTILPVYANVGGRWAEEFWVYDYHGQYITRYSDERLARRAISDRYDITHKLGQYAVR